MTKKDVDEEITRIADKIVAEFKPEKVVLFGSHAWGKPSPDSDVDLFIINDTEDTLKLTRQIDGALFPRKIAIDLLVYRPGKVKKCLQEKDPFVQDVLTNGRVLYERQD